jgi:large conductance mechanosensitive channel
MWKEFKEFAMRGNVIDMAVGIILGGAFNTIVKSLVDDIVMPPIGLALGRVDFANLYLNLSGGTYESLAKAQEAGAATINYGVFINNIISFLIVAWVMFLLVSRINKMKQKKKGKEEKPAPTTKECPYCFTQIPLQATRCPHCTSQLTE